MNVNHNMDHIIERFGCYETFTKFRNGKNPTSFSLSEIDNGSSHGEDGGDGDEIYISLPLHELA